MPQPAGGRARPGGVAAILAELGLAPKEAKTRIVQLREGGEGLDFLGFHHRWVRGNRPLEAPDASSPAGPHAGNAACPRPDP